MSGETTLRAHLLAADQLLGFALNAADVAAPLTLEEAIRQARKHAVAALALLGEAERHWFHAGTSRPSEYRLLADPEVAS